MVEGRGDRVQPWRLECGRFENESRKGSTVHPEHHLLLLRPAGPCHKAQTINWFVADCSPVASPATSSHSTRAALGQGAAGDTHDRSVANQQLVQPDDPICTRQPIKQQQQPSAAGTWLECHRGGRRCSRTRVRKAPLIALVIFLKKRKMDLFTVTKFVKFIWDLTDFFPSFQDSVIKG